MMPICEYMVREIFPAVRSIIAKELVDTLGYTQREAAEAMGVTQPAISQYLRNIRGNAKVEMLMSNIRVMEKIKKVTSELHKLSKIEKSKKMCEICMTIRKEGLVDVVEVNH